MDVRAKKRAPLHKGMEPTPKIPAQAYSFRAPIRGLTLSENIAEPQPGGARILDNWICTTNRIVARAGTSEHVALPTAVKSLFTYRAGTFDTFFGATDDTIYDITTTTEAASVTGQTSGVYSAQQFGTAGGDYLYAVNGSDSAQLFDGASWAVVDGVSPIAITGVDTSTLSHVWSYANRLFFVEKGTKTAWYLPIDSLGGAAQEFSLAGIFKRGGALSFGATWSMDAGDGLDDKCVFVSTEGEIAVYSGTNPGAATDWALSGVYYISKPLGPKATMQAGGDLLIATETGIVPISAAIQKDIGALETVAITRNITPYWQDQLEIIGNNEYEIVKWPSLSLMVVSQPGDQKKTCLVANLKTGAWSRFTGLDTSCLGFYDNSGFFGAQNGKVYRMQSGGSDDGEIYTAVYVGMHEHMGYQDLQKMVGQAKTTFESRSEVMPSLTMLRDYDLEISGPPSVPPEAPGISLWDVSQWDVGTWNGGTETRISACWESIGRSGHVASPEVQVSFSSSVAPSLSLISIDVTFDLGALVT